MPSSGNIGNKSSAPHNDGVNAVTDTGNNSASEADLLPIGQTASTTSSSGGRHIVTDVTDKDGGQGRVSLPADALGSSKHHFSLTRSTPEVSCHNFFTQ